MDTTNKNSSKGVGDKKKQHFDDMHTSFMVPLNHFAPANLERTVEIEVFSCAALDMYSNMY